MTRRPHKPAWSLTFYPVQRFCGICGLTEYYNRAGGWVRVPHDTAPNRHAQQ